MEKDRSKVGRWCSMLLNLQMGSPPCADASRLHAISPPAFPALQLVILLLLAMQGATGALTPHEAELTWRLQVSRAGHPCTM